MRERHREDMVLTCEDLEGKRSGLGCWTSTQWGFPLGLRGRENCPREGREVCSSAGTGELQARCVGYLDGCRSGHTRWGGYEARDAMAGPGPKKAHLLLGGLTARAGPGVCRSRANMSVSRGVTAWMGALLQAGSRCPNSSNGARWRAQSRRHSTIGYGLWPFKDMGCSMSPRRC